MKTLDIAKAAASARQVVSSKLDLHNLLEVLDDLAGRQNLIGELERAAASRRAEIEQLTRTTDEARNVSARELQALEAQLHHARQRHEQELGKLTAECRHVEEDRDRAKAELKEAQEQLARVRAALAGAATTVGA